MSPYDDEDQKYYDAVDQEDASFRLNAYSLNETQPVDKVARALELSQKNGLPRVAIESDMEGYEAQDEYDRLRQLGVTAPQLYKWLSQTPDNYAVTKDEADLWGSVEKEFGNFRKDLDTVAGYFKRSADNLKPEDMYFAPAVDMAKGAVRNPRKAATEVGDMGRSLASAAPMSIGSISSGLGTFLESAITTYDKNIISNIPVVNRGVAEAKAWEARFMARNPEFARAVAPYAGPSQILKTYGAQGKAIQKAWEPETMGFEDKVAQGLGQLVVQIGMAMATGGLSAGLTASAAQAQAATSAGISTTMFMAMGVDQQAEMMRAAGVDPNDKLLELSAGGAITGSLEMLRLERVMKILPPEVRNRVARSVVGRVAGQAFEEGIQEGVENVLQNFIATSYDPNATIFGGVGEAAAVGGTVGGVFQAIIELAMPGKSRAPSAQEINNILKDVASTQPSAGDKLISGVMEKFAKANLGKRSPEKAADLVNKIVEGTGAETVVIDLDGLAQSLTTAGMDVREALTQLGVDPDAIGELGQLMGTAEIPMGRLATPSAQLLSAQIIPHMRLATEDVTPFQKTELEGIAELAKRYATDVKEDVARDASKLGAFVDVQEQIYTAMKGSGLNLTEEQYRHNANIAATKFAYMAMKRGQDVRETFAERGQKIMGRDGSQPQTQGSAALEQKADEMRTRLDEAWTSSRTMQPKEAARVWKNAVEEFKTFAASASAQELIAASDMLLDRDLLIKMEASKLQKMMKTLGLPAPAPTMAMNEMRDAITAVLRSSDSLGQAQRVGYKGSDRGEAASWLRAVEKYGVEGMIWEMPDGSDGPRKARARAMGFDVDNVLYHGTTQDFEEFQGLTFLTSSQYEASAYGNLGFKTRAELDEYQAKVESRQFDGDELAGQQLPYSGIISDIPPAERVGTWATDQGVVTFEGDTFKIANKVTPDYGTGVEAADGSMQITVRSLRDGEAAPGKQYFDDRVGSMQVRADKLKEQGVGTNNQVIPVYAKGGKFVELDPFEANILGKRLQGNLSPDMQKRLDDLLAKIEGWKAEGYVGIKTVSDESRELGDDIPQLVIFDPANIRSTNAAFDPDQADSADLLASTLPNSMSGIAKMTTEQMGEWYVDNVQETRQDFPDGTSRITLRFKTDDAAAAQDSVVILQVENGKVAADLVLRGTMGGPALQLPPKPDVMTPEQEAERAAIAAEIRTRSNTAMQMFRKAIVAMRHWAALEQPSAMTFSGSSVDHEKLYNFFLSQMEFEGYTNHVVEAIIGGITTRTADQSNQPVTSGETFVGPMVKFVVLKDGEDLSSYAETEASKGRVGRDLDGNPTQGYRAVTTREIGPSSSSVRGLERGGSRAGEADPGGDGTDAENLTQPRRGGYDPKTREMSFTGISDASTFLHENSHWFLATLEELAPTEKWAADDLAEINSWYQSVRETPKMQQIRARYSVVPDPAGGVRIMYQPPADPVTRKTPAAMRLERVASMEEAEARIEWRERQEAWAETTEEYFMTGESPTPRLKQILRDFKNWLVQVYNGMLPGERANLTPEIRSMMDRILAVDVEVDAASAEVFRNARKMADEMLGKGIITPRQHKLVGDRLDKAREQVKEEMLARVMQEQLEAGQASRATERTIIMGDLARAFDKSPVGRAFNWLAFGEWKGDLPGEPATEGEPEAESVELYQPLEMRRPAVDLTQYGLTGPQMQVSQMILDGASYPEIRESLNLDKTQLQTHVRNSRKKGVPLPYPKAFKTKGSGVAEHTDQVVEMYVQGVLQTQMATVLDVHQTNVSSLILALKKNGTLTAEHDDARNAAMKIVMSERDRGGRLQKESEFPERARGYFTEGAIGFKVFYDERLSPRDNKVIEMSRNGASNIDIAEEWEISVRTVQKIQTEARRLKIDVPYSTDWQGSPLMNRVLRLESKGMTTLQIAKIIGTSTESVWHALNRAAEKGLYVPIKNRVVEAWKENKSVAVIADEVRRSPAIVRKYLADAGLIKLEEKSTRYLPPARIKKIASYGGASLIGEELFQLRSGFYSALTRLIENSSTARAPAAQWKSMIQNSPGIKAEEIEWSGLMDWLDMSVPGPGSNSDGMVDRDEILEYLSKRGIKMQLVIAGDRTPDVPGRPTPNGGVTELDFDGGETWDDPEAYQHDIDYYMEDAFAGDLENYTGSNRWEEFVDEAYQQWLEDMDDNIRETLGFAADVELALDTEIPLRPEGEEQPGYNTIREYIADAYPDSERDERIMSNNESYYQDMAESYARDSYFNDDPYTIYEAETNVANRYVTIFGNDNSGYGIYYGPRGAWRTGTRENNTEIYSYSEAEIQAEELAVDNGWIDREQDPDDEDAEYTPTETPMLEGQEGVPDLLAGVQRQSSTKWSSYQAPGPKSNYREFKIMLPEIPGTFIYNTHFSDKNIVAFMRVSDRELAAKKVPPPPHRVSTPIVDTMSKQGFAILKEGDGNVLYEIPLGGRTVGAFMDTFNESLMKPVTTTMIVTLAGEAVYPAGDGVNIRVEPLAPGAADKRNTFYIDELQSDWHQKGRQAIYDTPAERARAEDMKAKLKDENEKIKQDAAVSAPVTDQFMADNVVAIAQWWVKTREGAYNVGGRSSGGVLEEALIPLANGVNFSDLSSEGKRLLEAFSNKAISTVTSHYQVSSSFKMNDSELDAAPPGLQERAKVEADIFDRREKLAEKLTKVDAALANPIANAPFKGDAWINLSIKQALIAAVAEGKTHFAWADSGVLKKRWSDRYAELYENIYDKKMVKLTAKVAGVQPAHFENAFAQGQGYWIVPITEELRDIITDPEKGLSLFQTKAPTFYSALSRFIENSKTAKAPASQWKGMITNAPGIKVEEVEMSGVMEWLDLQTGPVTREAVAAFVAANGVTVEEVVKGETSNLTPEQQRENVLVLEEADRIFNALGQNDLDSVAQATLDPAVEEAHRAWKAEWEIGKDLVRGRATFEIVEAASAREDAARKVLVRVAKERREALMVRAGELRRLSGKSDVKFASWTLPGGENYTELLLTLPTEIKAKQNWRVRRGDNMSAGLFSTEAEAQAWIDNNGTTPGFLRIEREPDSQIETGYRSSHWSEMNVLAHVRFKERTGPNGERVLALEEVQSDWHQAGRERGYDDPVARKAVENKLDQAGYPISGEDARLAAEDGIITAEEAALLGNRSYVPNAPFKNNAWVELVLKRMVRYAAENGFDTVAWIPGNIQNGREVEADDNRSDFYDKILPNIANKFGKKYGARAERLEFDLGPDAAGSKFEILDADGNSFGRFPSEARANGVIMSLLADQPDGTFTVSPIGPFVQFHSLPITPQLREAALNEGFPLFQPRKFNPPGHGAIAPPTDIPPVRLDLKLVKDLYGEEAVRKLPAAVRRRSSTSSNVTDIIQQIEAVRKVLSVKRKGPQTLTQFIMQRSVKQQDGSKRNRQWGIKGAAGELRAMGLERLINEKSGMPIDAMRELAEEAGFIRAETGGARATEYGDLDATPNDLLDALAREAKGEPVVRIGEEVDNKELDDAKAWASWLEGNGVDIYETDKKKLRASVDAMLRDSDESLVSPDDAAAMFGFANGEELLKALSEVGNRDAFLNKMADQKMVEEFGDMMTDGTLQAEAAEAARLDIAHRQNEIEMEALARALGQQASANYAKSLAKDIIAMRTVKEIAAYERDLNNERQFGKQALRLVEKGDYPAALKAKQRQLVSMQLYTEGKKAHERIEKQRQDLLKYYTSEGRRDKIAGDYLEKIEAVLDDFELRVSKQGPKEQRTRNSAAEYVAWMTSQGREAEIAPEAMLLAGLNEKMVWRNMTAAEVENLVGTVQNLAHLGRTKDGLMKAQEKRKFRAVVSTLVERLRAAPSHKDRSVPFSPTLTDQGFAVLRYWDSKWAKIEDQMALLDGSSAGPLVDTLVQPFAEADAREGIMLTELTRQLRGLHKTLTERENRQLVGRRVSTPELALPGNRQMTMMDVLVIGMNWGNAGNREALTVGYGWKDEDVEAVLNRYLTDSHWNFIEGAWGIVEGLKPEAFAVEKRVTGVEPKAVIGITFTLASGRKIEGKYFPLKYDGAQAGAVSARHGRKEEADLLKEIGMSFTKPMTRTGHTIERVGSGGKPVKIAMETLFNHLENVVHDITHREALIDAVRIIKDPEFITAYQNAAGLEQYNRLMPWLTDIATKNGARDRGMFAGVMSHLRAGTSATLMGFKFGTAVQQFTGWAEAVPEIGLDWVLRGMVKTYAGGPITFFQQWQFVNSKSDYLMTRLQFGKHRDVRAQTTKVGDRTPLREIQDSQFMFLSGLDAFIGTSVWVSSYDKAVAGKVKDIAAGDEEAAVAFADRIVRFSLSSSETYALPEMMRGSEMDKWLTAIYTYGAKQYNRTRTKMYQVRYGQIGIPEFTAAMFVMHAVLPIMAAFLAARLLPGDDEEEEVLLENAGTEVMMNLAGMFPLFRDVVGTFIKPEFGYQMSPVEGSMEKVIGASRRAAEGKSLQSEAGAKELVFALGVVFKLPGTQLWVTGEYAYDVATGAEDPLEDPVDAVSEGLIRNTR